MRECTHVQMNWWHVTLDDWPHLSGPNMIEYGVLSRNWRRKRAKIHVNFSSTKSLALKCQSCICKRHTLRDHTPQRGQFLFRIFFHLLVKFLSFQPQKFPVQNPLTASRTRQCIHNNMIMYLI